MSIYVISVHSGDEALNGIEFLDLQLSGFKKNTSSSCKFYLGVYGDDYKKCKEDYSESNITFIDVTKAHEDYNLSKEHWIRLNFIYDHLEKNVEFDDEDIIVFADSDAWPIREWEGKINSLLEKNKAVAIERRENPEPLLTDKAKPYPHPSFFAIKANFWKKHYRKGLEWDLGPKEDQFKTSGPTIKIWLEDNGYSYAPLLRTNCIDIHPLYYGVYGDIIYHHGAGTRPKYDSADIWLRTGLNPHTDLDLRYPMILDFNQKISDLVLEEIKQNDLFINVYLLGML